MEYDPDMLPAFRKQYEGALNTLAPSAVYDFLQEAKATREF
jgi:hypothetical protein